MDQPEALALHHALIDRAPVLHVRSALKALHGALASLGVHVPETILDEAKSRLSEAAPAERHALRNFLAEDPAALMGAPLQIVTPSI